jgi:hypothetical protein
LNNYFFCFINIIFHYLLYFSRNSSPLALSDILFLDYIVNGEDMHELDEKISLFFSKKLEITRDQVSRDYANLRTRSCQTVCDFSCKLQCNTQFRKKHESEPVSHGLIGTAARIALLLQLAANKFDIIRPPFLFTFLFK